MPMTYPQSNGNTITYWSHNIKTLYSFDIMNESWYQRKQRDDFVQNDNKLDADENPIT